MILEPTRDRLGPLLARNVSAGNARMFPELGVDRLRHRLPATAALDPNATSASAPGSLSWFSEGARRIIILAWPSIGIILIWGHFRSLTKCKPDKPHEGDEANEWNEPARHI
jgi:hypothetical protein